MIRRPPRSTQSRSSAASDVYKRQGYALFLRSQIMRKEKGTAKMQEVWNGIRLGADAYLSRQLKTITPLIAVLTVVLFLSVYAVSYTHLRAHETRHDLVCRLLLEKK